MATTSHFDTWIKEIKPGAFEDIYNLYSSIKSQRPHGRFSCKLDPVTGGKLIATIEGSELLLATPAAEAAFLRLITGQHCGDLDMESWFSYNSNLAKVD